MKLMRPLLAGLFAATALIAHAQSATLLTGIGPWTQTDYVAGWKHYAVDLQGYHGEVKVEFGPNRNSCYLYTRMGSLPTQSQYDTIRQVNGANQGTPFVRSNSSQPPLQNGRIYISFYTFNRQTINFTVRRNIVPSHVSGMGSVATPAGTSFRTFAPFADSTAVAGTFNGWDGSSASMPDEGGGMRSVFYRGVSNGQEYKYVIRNGSQTLWKTDPYSAKLTNSTGNSVVYDQNAFQWQHSFTMPAWNKLVIYEMHIGTFNDLPGGNPGTFYTSIQRLDTLKDLGVNAVELLPVNEFPGNFSWGYNGSNPFAVESAYGGPEGLKAFIDAAHSRGIAVLIDLVHNHYGPNDLDLWRYDGWSVGNFGGLFFYNDTRANTPWGPRPDFGRGFVRQYIRDNALMWLEQYRADGIRWDSTLTMRTTEWGDNPDGWSLMQWINNEIDARQPWKINIAEDLQGNEWITKTSGSGGAGFDSQWTPNFVHPMRRVMTAINDGSRSMADLSNSITDGYNGSWLQRVVYTESHDEVANGRSRVPQEIDPANPGSYWARKRSTLGAAVMMTVPGVPMLFQGQEFLEDGYFQDTDPLDWTKMTTYAGVRQLYKDLIALRQNKTGDVQGLSGPNLNLFHVNDGAKVVAYHRWDQGGAGDDVVVLVNFSNTQFSGYTVGLPRGGRWEPVFNSDWNGYGSDYLNTFTAPVDAQPVPMHGLSHRGTFALGPYSCVILKLAP